MIQVPDQIKELYRQDSIPKNFRVHFVNGKHRDLVNTDFVSESVVFTESINSANNIKFGLCEGSTLEFQTYYNHNIRNLQIQAGIEIDVSSLLNEIDDYVIELEYDLQSMVYTAPYTGTYYFKGLVPGPDFPLTKYLEAGDEVNLAVMIDPDDASVNPVRIHVTLYRDVNTEDMNIRQSSDVPYPYYYIPYGYFFVDSCKRNAQNSIRNVIAYQNKYDNTTVTGKITNVKSFEMVKGSHTSDNNAPFKFNYLMAYQNFADIFGILDAINAQYTKEQATGFYWKDNNGQTKYENQNLSAINATLWHNYTRIKISPDYDDETVLGVYYLQIIFSSLDVFQTTLDASRTGGYADYANISIAGVGGGTGNEPGRDEPAPHSLHITPDNTNLFEFNFPPIELMPIAQEALKQIDIFVPEEERTDAYKRNPLTVASVLNAITPFIVDIGKSSSSFVTDEYGKIVVYNRTHLNTVLSSKDVANGKILVYPFNDGVTNYEGITVNSMTGFNSVPLKCVANNTTGCVGYTLLIPTKIILYESLNNTSITHVSNILWQQDIIRKEDLEFFKITVPTMSQFSKTYNRVSKKATAWYYNSNGDYAYYDKSIYMSPDFTNGDNEIINTTGLLTSFESLVELSAKYAKLDRLTNELTFVDIANNLTLYPSTDLFPDDPRYYPDEHLYPHGQMMLIDRSLWKSVWYDDEPSHPYNVVIATWQDANNETSYTATYTIVPEDKIVNPDDYAQYDISNNFFIKNNLLTFEQVQTIVNTIGEKLEYLKYFKSDIEMRGLPYLEAGDGLAILTKDGGFNTFIMRHRISGIHALMDNIENR